MVKLAQLSNFLLQPAGTFLLNTRELPVHGNQPKSDHKNGLFTFSKPTVVSGPCPGNRRVSSGKEKI